MSDILTLNHIHASYGQQEILHDITFQVPEGHTVGLVGESGSGKSTIARVITGLLPHSQGELLLEGRSLGERRSRSEHQSIQMIFQNPDRSLNPKYRIGQILGDAMLFHHTAEKSNVRELSRQWIQRMKLPEDTLDRYPASFSGGQKQRIAFARALCVRPRLLIADEPTSALDVSVQLQVLDLMKEIRQEMNLSILFISHDLGVINYLCDDVVLLRRGHIEEQGTRAEFFRHPESGYGRELLDAVPRIL